MPALSLSAFEASLEDPTPPDGLSAALAALWWSRRGGWDKAHAIVQDAPGADAAWVHAHLHRVEGDRANAGYWYRQAGKPVADGPVDNEREAMTAALLAA